MPYKIDWESKNTIWVRFFGNVSFTDLTNATNEFYNDERSDHVTGAFWDFSAMTLFDVGKDQVSEIAFIDNAASRYMKPIKAAFITADAAFTELARHYIEEMEQLETYWTNRLFSSMDDARAWVESQ